MQMQLQVVTVGADAGALIINPMQFAKEALSKETSALTITVPDRFRNRKITREQAVKEISALSQLFMLGEQKLRGIYLRIADTAREFKLTDGEVRTALEGSGFSPPRISELLRIINSPEAVYHRWNAGFIGFKAALRETRFYNITPTKLLLDRQKRRAAERLVKLATAGERIEVLGHYVTVELKDIDIKRIAENL